ncbi:MAG TPA: DUF4190 domain-containing protein [Mycobacterium sp.]|nr:DUF4190 domain-containing protein [Mycobacterium sp.]
MSAPGGGFGEGAHGDEVNPSAAGGRPSEQPDWQAPGDPSAAGYPPPPYPPPSYPPGYPAEYPPPGYGQPGYGGPPGGYGPPPYPGGYYPAPDYPGGYGQQEATPGMNGLAIASLVSSFVGVFCCIGSIVAIVLGTIALDQIKRTRQDGYALAIAGIVIGIATLIVVLIVAIFAIHSH